MKKLLLILITLSFLGCNEYECECVTTRPPPEESDVHAGAHFVVCHAGIYITLHSREKWQEHLRHGDQEEDCKSKTFEEEYYSDDCKDDGLIIIDEFNVAIRQVKCI